MRLWSIHPKYLDCKGLVALWREGLLAKSVLEGKTKSYRNHPQLERFKKTRNPVLLVNTYLLTIWKESSKRCYNFDKSKLDEEIAKEKIPITQGQIQYEFKHLMRKLESRSPEKYKEFKKITKIEPHPMFFVVKGDIEPWERVK